MYEIKKDVPLPKGNPKRLKYPELHATAAKMDIGDSVVVEDEYKAKKLSQYIKYRKNNDAPVGSRVCKASYRICDDGFRVWRTQ